MTNLEAIKQMDIEELALFLAWVENPNEYYWSYKYMIDYLNKEDGHNVLKTIKKMKQEEIKRYE